MPGTQRKPKVVSIPAPKKSGPGSDEPFTWTTEAGGEFTVPSLAKLFNTAGEIRKMRKLSNVDLVFYIIERDCDEEQLEAFDSMGTEEFERFSEEWAEHSGASLGEFSAS